MIHPLFAYLLISITSFALVVILTPLFRRLAWRLDAVDRPTGGRKIHDRPVPCLGGLPFYIAFLAVTLGLETFAPQYAPAALYPLAAAGLVIVLMGVYDDLCDLSSKIKLPIEIVVGVALYAWGFRSETIMQPLGGALYLGPVAVIVTVVWIVGVMNAVNFADGLDGLAAGLVGIAAVALFAAAWVNGQTAACVIMAFLAGVAAAFLIFNFHPASVFMGDAGALFLGFLLGAATLIEQQKGAAVIALTIPILVMAVPLADTALSFLRRMRRAPQRQFFQPDRQHLHHRLLDLGLNQRQATLVLYYAAACMGLLAFILSMLPATLRLLALLLAAALIIAGVALLRSLEAVRGFPKQSDGSGRSSGSD